MRLFFSRASHDAERGDDLNVVNAVLKHYDSEPLLANSMALSKDDVDALASAAALCSLAATPEVWNPPGLDEKTRIYEGWIFGAQ